MTIADQLIEEGRLEGRQTGEVEGRRTMLKKQLTRRFGTLPDWAADRLNQGTAAELENWGERLLDAPDLKSVFTEARQA